MYGSFLLLMSQLSFQGEGKISLGNQEIYVCKRGDRWELSSKILFTKEVFPRFLNDCFVSNGNFPVQPENIQVKKVDEGISLVQLIEAPYQYLEYKKLIEEFLSLLAFWKEEALRKTPA